MDYQIIGKHLRSNPSFLKAAYLAAAECLDRVGEPINSVYEMSNLVQQCLKLPVSDKGALIAIFSFSKMPKTKEEAMAIANAIVVPEEKVEPKKIEPTPTEKPAATVNPVFEARKRLKESILGYLNEVQITTIDYLKNTYGDLILESKMTLENFLDANLSLSEISRTSDVVSVPSVSPTLDNLMIKICREHNNEPFSLNDFALRLGISAKDAERAIKTSSMNGMVIWSDGVVWNISCFQVAEKDIEKIKATVAMSPKHQPTVADLLHDVFVGKFGEHYYTDVDDSIKIKCLSIALSKAGFTGYQYSKPLQKFVNYKEEEKKQTITRFRLV